MTKIIIITIVIIDLAKARTRWPGTAMPSQPLKLAPHPNMTDVAPTHMSYHRKMLPVGVSVTHVPVLLSR